MPSKFQQPTVMLHGWGADSQIWGSFKQSLQNYAEVYTLDLPGFGDSPTLNDYSQASLLRWMADSLPSQCNLVGLSLGGMLCRAFAAEHPKRVVSLITISSNLQFVATEQYPHAMSGDSFNEFMTSWTQDSQACLKRFASLQAQGDAQQRQLIRTLRGIESKIDPTAGKQLLALLGDLDNRSAMAQIHCPSLAIFGQADSLVPVNAKSQIPDSVIIQGAGHLPHLTAGDDVVLAISQFFESQRYRLDKQKVADSFGRAAERYDVAAQLQHRTGEQLLDSITLTDCPKSIVDLGCGTGYHSIQLQTRFSNSQVIGVDISPGMLAYAKTRYPACQWLCSDAENLQLARGSQDLIFSNFTLQWCDDLSRLAAEIYRVLAINGQLYIVVPGPQTLAELRAAWLEVDDGVHVNRFASLEQWQTAFFEAGFKTVNLQSTPEVEYHQSVRELLLELKNIGAHNNNAGKASHLTGKRQLKALYNAYEKFRLPDGTLPASWEIISGCVVKHQ